MIIKYDIMASPNQSFRYAALYGDGLVNVCTHHH